MTTYPAPIRISQPTEQQIAFTWPDGTVSVMALKNLRDECPCAGCKGEVILGKVYRPMQLPTFTPGMYELESITPVGSYGIQITWKDGHHTGIYHWEYLHLLCGTHAGTRQND